MEVGFEDGERLGKFGLGYVEFFELAGDFGFAALAGDTVNGGEADGVEGVDEGVQGSASAVCYYNQSGQYVNTTLMATADPD